MGLKELEKRLEQEPGNLGLRVMVAGAMHEAGRRAESTELYRTVAIAYRDQGRIQQAIAVCRGALEQAPDDARLRELLTVLSAPPPPPPPTPPPPRAAVPIVVPLTARPVGPVPVPAVPAVPARPVVAVIPARAPARRSSMDETPLPRPVPYHVHDPTSSAARISLSELPTNEGADTRPGSEPTMRPSVEGLASAARKISKTLSGVRSSEIDVTAELDTRRQPRVAASDIERISEPPPTVPIERIEAELDDDAATPIPLEKRDAEDELTNPRDHVVDKRRPIDSSLFAPLPTDRRGLVLSRFYKRSVRKSGTVIRQGETGHPLVLVVGGRLEVRAERANGTMAMLEAIGELEFIGETSLLARAPAEANVVAASDAELLLLSPHDVFEIAGAFPVWWAHLKQVAERRTKDHDRRR